MLKDFFLLAGRSIAHRRMRSWLTVIGVFIGITAVVALISIGLGLERTITDQIASVFGVDTFIIMNEGAFGPQAHGPGGAEEYALDLATLRAVEGVKVAAAVRERTAFLQGPPRSDGTPLQGFFPVSGLSPELITEFESFIGKLEVQKGGRLFDVGEEAVTVLGSEIANRFQASVGDTVLVAGDGSAELSLTVVGILVPVEEDKGSRGGFAAGMNQSQNQSKNL